jgi:hypothetical protein
MITAMEMTPIILMPAILARNTGNNQTPGREGKRSSAG